MASEIDATIVRLAFELLPDGVSHGERIDPRAVHLPRSHLKALDPNALVVIGMRGAGKTFWWAALQDPTVRRVIAETEERATLSESTEVVSGFGVLPQPDAYPTPGELLILRSQHRAVNIWRTVLAWQLARGTDHEMARLRTWEARASYLTERPDDVVRLFHERDAECDWKGTDFLMLFDGLDRCAVDRVARADLISGLLQTALEVRSFRRIRLKIFLRLDQVQDLATSNFVDSRKVLASKVELTWPPHELYGLLWHQLANGRYGSAFRSFLQAQWRAVQVDDITVYSVPRRFVTDELGQRESFHRIAGEWLGPRPQRGDPYAWIPTQLADAHGRVSARSFLGAMRAAARDTAAHHADHPYGLHYSSVKRGVVEASRTRAGELCEDYPWFDDAMQSLEGLTVPRQFEEIGDRWLKGPIGKRLADSGFDISVTDLRAQLEAQGVFQRLHDGRINIPNVFRVAYGLGRDGGAKLHRHQGVPGEALNWALNHILRHGDTDIFPPSFEYKAIDNDRKNFLASLSEEESDRSTQRSHFELAVLKDRGFRVAHQLDPLDAILYTARVYEIGHTVEEGRMGVSTACSYRFQPTTKGDFYPTSGGWETYTQRSQELAMTSSHVLYVDIADFYGQIFHSRLRTSLERCGVDSIRSRSMENFLRQVSDTGRGIPVGPSASHLLAEAFLNDLDCYLRTLDLPFVRYVDDVRIFANKERLTRILADLTTILAVRHGLTMQSGKTEISETDVFVRRHMGPVGRWLDEEDGSLDDLDEAFTLGDIGYDLGEEIDEQKRHDLDENDAFLAACLRRALRDNRVGSGELKGFLRRSKRLSVARHVFEAVCEDIELLVPVIDEVCRVVRRIPPEIAARNSLGPRLVSAVSRSEFSSIAFVGLWVTHLFAERPDMMPFDDALRFAQGYEDVLGIRPQALLARANVEESWVRDRMTNLQGLGPWDRRAVLWAASIVPESDRLAWLDDEVRVSGLVEEAIVRCLHGEAHGALDGGA